MKSTLSSINSFFSSTTKAVTSFVSSLTMNENEYLMKSETTDKEILNYLSSSMEMEVILGLKITLINANCNKDISNLTAKIFDVFATTKNYYAKRLCLSIIDIVTLEKRDEVLLMFNTANKNVNDQSVINRLCILKVLCCLDNQNINTDALKTIMLFANDSNPIIRRYALIAIIKYLNNVENTKTVCDSEMFVSLLKKYLYDDNYFVNSSAFLAMSEIGITDYIAVGLHERIDYILSCVNDYDDGYYDRAMFVIIDFMKIYLINNIKGNIDIIAKIFNSMYTSLKRNIELYRNCTTLCAIYQYVIDIEKSVEKDNEILSKIFKKDYKRLVKVGGYLINCLLESKNEVESHVSLDIIYNYVSQNGKLFNPIKTSFSNDISYFFVNINDINRKYLYTKKLQILIELCSSSNIQLMLSEFKREINYPSIEFKSSLISSIFSICVKRTEIDIIQPLIELLIDFLKIKNDIVISDVILSLSRLLSFITSQKKYILIYAIKNYKKNITNPTAKANVISMIINNLMTIPTVAIDFYRRTIIDIDIESDEVKMQLISLATAIKANEDEIIKHYQEGEVIRKKIDSLIEYAIMKSMFDENYKVREKSRMISLMITNNIQVQQSEHHTKHNQLTKTQKDNDMFLDVIVNNNKKNKHIAYKYEKINEDMKEKMKAITLNDLIKATKSINKEESKENILISDKEKYSSCKMESNTNVSDNVSNINSGIDIEEKKKHLKNQLDEFLNSNDDEDDGDDFEVEITKG